MFFCAFVLAASVNARPQEQYVPETDPLVLKKLSEWQDLKFGLLMHWGPYSQWGIVESWSICAEDERRMPAEIRLNSIASEKAGLII